MDNLGSKKSCFPRETLSAVWGLSFGMGTSGNLNAESSALARFVSASKNPKNVRNLNRLPNLMASAHPSLVTWALLHDLNTSFFGGNVDLATVGVRRCDGSPKPGWYVLVGGDEPANSLDGIQYFPNPLRPEKGNKVMTFFSLPASARLRIYTQRGELVRDFSADASGRATWDGTNASGKNVVSGIYLVLAESSGAKKTFRIAVQR